MRFNHVVALPVSGSYTPIYTLALIAAEFLDGQQAGLLGQMRVSIIPRRQFLVHPREPEFYLGFGPGICGPEAVREYLLGRWGSFWQVS